MGLNLGRRVYDVKFGFCSIGVLTNCYCGDTLFNNYDILDSKYFSGPLIAPTSFSLMMYGSTSALTKISSLTDSIGLICGDKTGQTWCGNRAPVVLFSNGTVYDMTWPNSLFNFNSVTGMLNIQPSQISQLGTLSFILRAQLSDYSSLGYFPQTTVFSVTVTPNCNCPTTKLTSTYIPNTSYFQFDLIDSTFINVGFNTILEVQA